MNIQVAVTKGGGAQSLLEEVVIDRPLEEWSEPELYELCNKMQFFIDGDSPVRTCMPVDDLGYVVSVEVGNDRVVTSYPLALSAKLAVARIWNGTAG